MFYISDIFEILRASKIQMIYIIVGLTAFLIFLISAIMSIIKRVKKNKKDKRIYTVIAIASFVIYLVSGFTFSLSNTGEFCAILDPDIGFDKLWCANYYKNNLGRKVVYDKNGNEYTFRKYCKGFKYYDRDGNEYELRTTDIKERCYEIENLSTGKVYNINQWYGAYTMYVDEDGYVVIVSKQDEIPDEIPNQIATYYVDENGRELYDWDIISWDKDGNMIYFYDYSIEEMHRHNLPPDEE